jgi:paraquat-inducible protein A
MRTNKIAFALIVLSFALLVPGLLKPLLTITASLELMGAKREIFTETRSIIQTVRSLHESGNNFVAGLILLFSVIVPFAKAITLLVVLAIRDIVAKLRLHRFIDSISKWSMADVFLVGVYLAYLSAKATDNLDAEIHQGFYYFAAYCLVSIASLHFMRFEHKRLQLDPVDDR